MKNVELQQDEYSLSRPTFPTPSGGTLTVMGWKGKSSSGNKRYVVKCDICSQDPELFGDGTFTSLKGNLLNEKSPCGCASNHRWSESQYKIRISREAIARGLKFIGWASEYRGNKTKLLLSCHLHGRWNSTDISKFMCGRGCPACKIDKTRESSLKEDSLHTKSFMKTGAFLEDTKFWRSGKKNSKGWFLYWCYTCPKCSHDEHVKSGLCSGVFESHISDLKIGRVSCRCATAYRWTQEQREYQIKKEMKRRKNKNLVDYNFSGWTSNYKNYLSKFKYLCKDHGEQAISVSNFLRGSGCPECANQSQRQAYINVVMDGDIPVALKLGIANSSPTRLRVQNSRNLFQMKNISVWVFHSVKACKDAEAECKSKLNCGILSARELKDGWTETTSLTNLNTIIGIYRKHGGSDVPTARL